MSSLWDEITARILAKEDRKRAREVRMLVKDLRASGVVTGVDLSAFDDDQVVIFQMTPDGTVL